MRLSCLLVLVAACGSTNNNSNNPDFSIPMGCTPNPSCTLAALPATGDDAADCVARVNQFRTQCACAPALARWTDGEACAAQDAQYDSTRTPHAGFKANICASGFAQDECPMWPSIGRTISDCLQMMWDEGPGPTGCANDPTCYSMHGHYINMSSTSYTKVACGWYSNGGQVWAVQNFR